MSKNESKASSPVNSGEDLKKENKNSAPVEPENVSNLESEIELLKKNLLEAENLLNEKEQELNNLKEELETLTSLKNTSVKEEVAKKTSYEHLTFTFQKRKYSFHPKTPAKISIAGSVYTLEELIKNKELMTSLIVGNSPFIKKI